MAGRRAGIHALLKSLGDEYERLVQEVEALGLEKRRLTEEIQDLKYSGGPSPVKPILREELAPSREAPVSTLAKPKAPSDRDLGHLMQVVPTAEEELQHSALPNVVPEADGSAEVQKGSATTEPRNIVTIQAIVARGLQKSPPGTGATTSSIQQVSGPDNGRSPTHPDDVGLANFEVDPLKPQARFAVRARVGQVQKRTPSAVGQELSWDSPLEFSCEGDSIMDLELLKLDEAQPSVIGKVSIDFRAFPTGKWQHVREALTPVGSGDLELELRRELDSSAGRVSSDKARIGWRNAVGALVKRTGSGPVDTKKSKHLSNLIDAAGRKLDSQAQARQAKHFAQIFGLDGTWKAPKDSKELTVYNFVVDAKTLTAVLEKRTGMDWHSHSPEVEDTLQQLNLVGTRLLIRADSGKTFAPENGGVPFKTFCSLMTMPDLHAEVAPAFEKRVVEIQEALLGEGVEEVIDHLVRAKVRKHHSMQNEKARTEWTKERMLLVLNIVVNITVIVSILCLGLSMDHHPKWVGWLIIEGISAVIFLTEITLKHWAWGVTQYWCGPEKLWNWSDAGISAIAVFDVIFSIVTATSDTYGDAESGSNMSKFSLMIKVLRLLRMARVMKMLRSPIIQELANMLVGFVLGSPALFWVGILMWGVVGLLAMGLRNVVGPKEDDGNFLALCGNPDGITESSSTECFENRHKVYGEEYCATVGKCMFTVFRCMIGDCSSRGGQSLAAHLSYGYEWYFDIVYCIGMIVLIFGLFNVITAIFVEATMAGLKYNDVKQKLQSLYEAGYVRRKLEDLVARIRRIGEERHFQYEKVGGVDDVVLTHPDFILVLDDPYIMQTLSDLDIEIHNHEGLFDVFDYQETGTVTLPEFIGTLMKMRGGLQKSDLIAPWVALAALRQDFRDLSSVMIKSQGIVAEHTIKKK